MQGQTVNEREAILAAAEHVVALLLCCTRRLRITDTEARATGAPFPYPTERRLQRELEGKRLLLIGFDEVAQNVARKAAGLDMIVGAWGDREGEGDESIRAFDDLNEGLGWADYISLHLEPAGDLPFIGEEQFGAMKEGTYFVNISSTSLVDEKALVKAMKSGKVAAVGLDDSDKRTELKRFDSALLTPHRAHLCGSHQ